MEKIDLSHQSEKSKKKMESRKQKIIKQLLEKKCVREKLKKLNYSVLDLENNLGDFIIYADDYEMCINCKSLGECKKDSLGTQIDLEIDDQGYLQKKISFCPYKKRDLKLKQNFLIRDFDDDFLNVSLKDIEFREGRELLQSCIGDFIYEKKENGIYVFGQSETGKSFPLIALCNTLIIKENKSCAFVNVKSFINNLKSTFNQSNYEYDELMKKTKQADILILDDLGDEKQSEWVRDDILSEIIGDRNKKNKITFITSVYSLDELTRLYTFNFSSKKGDDFKRDKFIQRIKKACKNFVKVE